MITENRDKYDLLAEREFASLLPLVKPKFNILEVRTHNADDSVMQIIGIRWFPKESYNEFDMEGDWMYLLWDVDLGVTDEYTESEMELKTKPQ